MSEKTKTSVRDIIKETNALLRQADEYYETNGKPEKSMRIRMRHFKETGKLPTHEEAAAVLKKLTGK